MFKKKPVIKPLSPLRSSDRRKLADFIIKSLELSPQITPELSADATEEEKSAALTTALTILRTSLLPDGTLSAKFTSTVGPDLKRVNGSIYVGVWGKNSEQRVLWIREGDNGPIIPTVYTLWANPHIIPLLHTPALVVEKLQTGADLMIPGLADDPPFPQGAKTGSIVAVASVENPAIPVVVGRCLIDISQLKNVRGVKGSAMEGLHWSGDEIWSWSEKGTGGLTAMEAAIEGWTNGENEKPENLEDDKILADQMEGVILDDTNQAESEDKQLVEVVEKTWTTKEIDETIRKSFIFAIHQHISDGEPPNFGLDLPLNQSFIVSKLITPFLPIFTKSDADALQMKKTSWKNVRKFLKALDQDHDKLILVKEGKGESSIWDIDFTDERFKTFVPYRLPKKAKQQTSTDTTSTTSTDPSIGQELKVSTVYKPKSKLSDMITSQSYLSTNDIRTQVNAYIDKENLLSSENRRMVSVNPFIANNVLDDTNPNQNIFFSKQLVPRDKLVELVIAQCSPYHTINRVSQNPSPSSKPKAGHLNKIHIILETRSGNKTITKVSGLETYFINPQSLADELRKICAGSSSVERMMGSSDKNPVMEVVVQGPQTDAIIKALDRRGVDKKWVEVTDKVKGKKKK